MVTLAVLPGMLKTSLVVADLANPGNSSKAINLLVSQPGIVGLVFPIHAEPTHQLAFAADQDDTAHADSAHQHHDNAAGFGDRRWRAAESQRVYSEIVEVINVIIDVSACSDGNREGKGVVTEYRFLNH